jgi:AcrR family transcriptional regulator
MYKLCKTEESSKRQREIEDILLKLMHEKNYDDITVSEICIAANIPRKSFYRYFDGKEGVKQALLFHTLSDFDYFRPSRENLKLREEFEGFFIFWKSKREFLEAFDKSGLIGLLVESATTYSMNDFSDVKKYLSEAGEMEKELAYQFVICGLMTMMINWYRSGFVETVPNLARTTAKLITKPLFENLTRTE